MHSFREMWKYSRYSFFVRVNFIVEHHKWFLLRVQHVPRMFCDVLHCFFLIRWKYWKYLKRGITGRFYIKYFTSQVLVKENYEWAAVAVMLIPAFPWENLQRCCLYWTIIDQSTIESKGCLKKAQRRSDARHTRPSFKILTRFDSHS